MVGKDGLHSGDAKRLHVEPEKVESEVARRAQEAKPLDMSKLSNQKVTGGENADYLTARIARDRPDILEEMKAGKYRSVRQAAIEAGIVNDALSDGGRGCYNGGRIKNESIPLLAANLDGTLSRILLCITLIIRHAARRVK